MHILEIKLAGRMKPGQLPEFFATIHRVPGNDYITVTLVGPDGDRVHQVQADDPDDVLSMAQCLQYHLDGPQSPDARIGEYSRLLHPFID